MKISVQLKIISMILIFLILTITSVLFFTITNQRNNLFESLKSKVIVDTQLLNVSIRNIMLSGEAPIVQNTIKDIKSLSVFKSVDIYRKDGTNAFHDYQTLDYVNKKQDKIFFEKTPRTQKDMFINENFSKVIKTKTPVEYENKKDFEYEFFFPIMNYPECRSCHGEPGSENFIRGIAHFNISTKDIYDKINIATKFLLIFLGLSIIILGFILIITLRKIIISPLIKIGKAVNKIGEGDLTQKIEIKSKDELGDLSDKINQMIKGLRERFELSKYVSKSTDEIIKKGETRHNDSIKKQVTIFFADIRGFTSYTEANEPEIVISNLNKILELESEIIHSYDGDIDKFVGDEIMAIFEDPIDAIKAGFNIIKSLSILNDKENINLKVGIGINTGYVVAGNIGSIKRKEYAMIGDTVNLASRLCSIAKEDMILISEETYKFVESYFDFKLIPDQKIKGKSKPINIYAVKSIR